MGHPFSHSKAKSLLKRVATFFDPGKAFLSAKRNFLFICGGDMDGNYMRPRFQKFATKGLPNWHMFLAEKILDALVSEDGTQHHNLAQIEELIGEIADAIVLFPESPGSFAELGYFAKTPKLARKSLVISDYSLQGQDSFIALVPIRLIDRMSIYDPSIRLIYGEEADFSLIEQRLAKRTKRKRKSFKREKRTLDGQEYFFVVLELIRIFRVITIDGIGYVVKSIFGHARIQNIKHVVAILVGTGFVFRCGPDDEFCCVTPDESTFMEFKGISETDFTFRLLDFYRTCAPEIYNVVNELPK